ncbi:MAG: two-component system cell cycle response regulator [Candidatus Azotimanducaceae bacterium]|jgi:two-component system cell cycle response regulator
MPDNTQYKIQAGEDGVGNDTSHIKRPCLVMIRGDFIGEVYELIDDVTMIGRSDDIDLTISDTSLSRRHAMLVNRVDGFFVSDLGSTNGTFVNKELVNSARHLNEGDKLTLGAVTFKFTFQDADDTEYHQLLRNMAIKDGLTRIYNKRYFMELLSKEYEYNRRNHNGLSIVMFDIDHFKEVNDTYGHLAGDLVLRELAQLVETEARGYDLFARFGGEEFVFLMRGATLTAAVGLAERVRTSVEGHGFQYEDQVLKVTISLGVSYWDGGEEVAGPEQIIAMVDKHLYEAKGGGRNRICY